MVYAIIIVMCIEGHTKHKHATCKQEQIILKKEIVLCLKYILLLLLQTALQPLWVLVCSTIVEYSQQEGFYRVPFPAARQTPNLEDQ